MATASLTVDDTTASPGQVVKFTPSIAGLAAAVPSTSRTATGHVTATLSDGTVLDADSPAVTITTPGTAAQTVVSTVVVFDGQTLTRSADGTYPATIR